MYVFRSHIWKVGMTVFAEKSKYAVKSDLLIWSKTEIFNEVFKYVNIEKYTAKVPLIKKITMSSHQPFNTVPPIGEVSLALYAINYETKCQHWLFSSNRRDSSFFYWIFERDFTSLLGLLFSLSFLFGFLLPCYIFLFRLVFPFCFSFSLDFYSIVVTFWISSNFFL